MGWAPQLGWSDATLFYGSYSRGYKGGGFNPAFDPREFPDTAATFEPEFVNAFEIGTKNQLLANRLQANLTAFYYDYSDLQISRVLNRTSFNENADAEIYGLESEFMFAPTTSWLLNANLSLLQTDKYEEVLRQSVSKLWAGEDPKSILDAAAAEWDAITEKIGVDKQKAVYADWASKSGAYPKM